MVVWYHMALSIRSGEEVMLYATFVLVTSMTSFHINVTSPDSQLCATATTLVKVVFDGPVQMRSIVGVLTINSNKSICLVIYTLTRDWSKTNSAVTVKTVKSDQLRTMTAMALQNTLSAQCMIGDKVAIGAAPHGLEFHSGLQSLRLTRK